jgi:CHAT domain-containing protein/Tfp pilus assembly protein PilF
MRAATVPVRPLVLGLGLLLGLGVFGFAQQPAKQLTLKQKEMLKERDRFQKECQARYDEGKLPEAIAAAEKMLAIERSVFGDVHQEVVESLDVLAQLHEKRDDFAAAVKRRREILVLQTKLRGEKAWQVADARLDLKDVETLARMDAAARRELRQAEQWMSRADADNKPGKYQEGAQWAEKALATRLRLLGDANRQAASSAGWAGILWGKALQPAKARPHLERALAINKKAVGENHPDTAWCLNELGAMLFQQGDYAAARPCLEQALAVRKEALGEDHPDTVKSLNNLGALLLTQGDYAAARPRYEQALASRKKVLGENHSLTAAALQSLGSVLHERGEYDAARRYHEQALAILKKARGESHPDTALCLNSLGSLLFRQGEYAAARPYLEQALALKRKARGENHPETATFLNNLGSLLFQQGDDAAARSCFEQALALRKKVLGDSHPDTAASLNTLGALLSRQGDYRGARAHLQQALTVQRQALDLAAVALSERQQLAMTQSARGYLDSFLSLSPEAAVSPEEFYQQVLAWKGAVILRQRQLRLLRQDPQLAPLAAELQAVSTRLANESFAIPDVANLAEHRRQLTELTQKKEALEVELARKSDSFRNHSGLARLTPDQLRKVLPAGTALVDFLEYTHYQLTPGKKGKTLSERRLVAFVVRRDRPLVRVDLGSMAPIAAAVADWRRAIERRGGGSDRGFKLDTPQEGKGAVASQRALRQRLWEPLQPYLGKAEIVLISLDGVLASVPFAALPAKEAGHFLLEEVTLAVVPLPRLLPALLQEKAAPAAAGSESLLLVGDIDYGASAGATRQELSRTAARTAGGRGFHFTRLDGTRGEILALRDTFERRFRKGRVTLLREEGATESAVRASAPRHRWLHIATHGFFAPPEVRSAAQAEPVAAGDLFGKGGVTGFHPGLLSGLALAGANRAPQPGQDDGILTALEVGELDLRGVELAVLSACETGLGKVAGGEGLLGLQRAFQVAGTGSVIASLWSVDDTATRLLMERFYDNLWKRRLPKAEALRQAQLYLLREGPRRGLKLDGAEPAQAAPPYYWAAFVLSGDWR